MQQEHRDGLPRKLQQEHRDGLPRKLQQEHRDGLPRKLQREHRDGLPRKLQQEHRDGLPRKQEHRRLPRIQNHRGLPRKQEHRRLPRKQEHRDGLPRKWSQEDHGGWPRKLAQEDRDGWPRKFAQEHRDGLPRKLAQEDCDEWPRKLAQEDHDGLPRKLAQEDRDGWPRNLIQEDRDGLPRTVAKFDARSPGRQSKHWAHEHCDGLFGKLGRYRVNLKSERAELREGLPGKMEKVVTHEQKKVIVKGSRRVDGVLWRHQAHVSTRRSHMSQSNIAKQYHPDMHNIHKPCCTVDRRLECETRILNHEHVCSLSSRNSQQQWTLHTRVRHGRDLCV